VIGRGDALVLAACAALIAASFVLLAPRAGVARSALVETSRGERRELALDRDARLAFVGRRGLTTVEVRDRQARILDSACEQKLCLRAGWLVRAGESSACLPNGVTLRLLGADPDYDALTL